MHDNAYFNGCTSNSSGQTAVGSGGSGGVAPETAVYAAMKHTREPEPRNLNVAAATGSKRAGPGGPSFALGSEPRSRCDTGTSESSGRGARAAATRRATITRRSRATATTRRPGPTRTRRGTPSLAVESGLTPK